MELQGLRVGHKVISSLHDHFLLYGLQGLGWDIRLCDGSHLEV